MEKENKEERVRGKWKKKCRRKQEKQKDREEDNDLRGRRTERIEEGRGIIKRRNGRW